MVCVRDQEDIGKTEVEDPIFERTRFLRTVIGNGAGGSNVANRHHFQVFTPLSAQSEIILVQKVDLIVREANLVFIKWARPRIPEAS